MEMIRIHTHMFVFEIQKILEADDTNSLKLWSMIS